MNNRFSDLKRKEVISACDGTRIGFVDDLIIDRTNARIAALVIYSGFSFLGFFGGVEDYIIYWDKIELIGEDTIIISCKTPKPEKRPKKRRFFSKKKKNFTF